MTEINPQAASEIPATESLASIDKLERLISAPSRITPQRTWSALTNQARRRTIAVTLDKYPLGTLRVHLEEFLAMKMNFRSSTVRKWSVDRLATEGARLGAPTALWAAASLHELLKDARLGLLASLLDRIGVIHQDGDFDEEVEASVLDLAGIGQLAADLAKDHLREDVILSMVVGNMFFPDALGELDQWLEKRGFDALHGHVSGKIEAVLPAVSDDTPPVAESVPIPTSLPGFTVLDKRLILAIVDTASGIDNAASEDDIDDLIDEVLHLDGRRHRSYFHAGYRDVLLKRPILNELLADNETRRGWYWAGVVSGLARTKNWPEIVQCFDRESAVRSLGDGTTIPADAAAHLVFTALCEVGRFSEAASFVGVEAACASRKLRSELLGRATSLIRGSRVAEASPMLERLNDAVTRDDFQDDSENAIDFELELKRRRALCLRQLGQIEPARELLQELAGGQNPIIRSNALTDLGLLKAGVQKLGDMCIPSDFDERRRFIESLTRGLSDFKQAADTETHTPAHSNFILGVLALARDDYAEAVNRLDPALTYFQRLPETYSIDGTLHLAELYLGIALCHRLDQGDFARLPQAHKLIEAGLNGGVRFPLHLVESTVEALAITRDELAAPTAETILTSAGDGVLDRLVRSVAGKSQPITTALLRRSGDTNRSLSERAADSRAVLPMLLAQSRIDDASDVLDFLQASAELAVGSLEFEQILSDESRYGPAWSPNDALWARVRLFEQRGDLLAAAHLLEPEFHALVTDESSHSLIEAESLLERISCYGGSCAGIVEPLAARLKAIRHADHHVVVVQSDTPVDILVVGGDERQERLHESVRQLVSEHHSAIRVRFLHTGWKGNWVEYGDEFERIQSQVDGVVLMTLMRTNLGRHLRRVCAVPWRGCGGRGARAISGSVLAAAEAALERRDGR